MPAKLPAKRADEWRPLFLRTLRQSANVRAACEAAGISRQAAYKSRETSPAFAAEWDTAVQEAVDGLELAAWARARKSSDGLLLALLKAHRPALYRETVRNEHSGPDGGPIVYDDYRARLQQRLRAEPAGTDQSRLPDRAE